MIAPLENVIDKLKSLPGIGRKSAERVTFYLLNAPERELSELAAAITSIKTDVHRCSRCYNFASSELCDICSNSKRDHSIICVVGQPWEIFKIESTREFHGTYHVLGGLISQMDSVSSTDLTINSLLERVKSEQTTELILALEPKLEGDITATHIASLVKPLGVTVTQIAQGVPVGRDLEFADEVTLQRALRGRTEI